MANEPHTTFPWPGKPSGDTPPSVIAQDFAALLDRLERVQKLEAAHAVTPFSLKEADLIDEQWNAMMRQTSPKSAGKPTRLGDHVLLQARLLIHVALQVDSKEDHAAIVVAMYDLTLAAADRVPPRVYALLDRALNDVADGYFPMVHPSDALTPRA